MLLSIALILLLGMLAGKLVSFVNLPPLTGMLVTGILAGPYCFNLISASVLNISSELRRIALIIILIRAGLNLKSEDLKKAGRPAVLMCFVPASFEILGMALIAPPVFHITIAEALLLGSVIAAVSPAVIVPHMIKIMEQGYGQERAVPQMVLAGASCDDVFVIVLFSCFVSLVTNGSFNAVSLLRIPVSIVLGIGAGILCGYLFSKMTERFHPEGTVMTVILLCLSFLLVSMEDSLNSTVGFSGLIGVMAMGMTCGHMIPEEASKVSSQSGELWKAAQVILFVLVGAAVEIQYALHSFAAAALVISGVLLFRMAGVFVSTLGSHYTKKERLFAMLAYTPKATVQAAIGPLPLAMGLSCGSLILTIAVCSILLTAPLGAFMIDLCYPKLLEKQSVPVRKDLS